MVGDIHASATDVTWVLAQLKPNAAQIAVRHLRRQGFGTFLPLVEETERRQGRFVPRQKPLFPGYLFVSIDAAHAPWGAINNTTGVTRLVSVGMTPCEVPVRLMDELFARCDDRGQMRAQSVQVGDTVRLNTGPFADFVGRVEHIDAAQRAFVLLDLMGSTLRVRTPAKTMRLA